jgi:hypothetical protein
MFLRFLVTKTLSMITRHKLSETVAYQHKKEKGVKKAL